MACDSSLMAFAAFITADLKASKTFGFISPRRSGNVEWAVVEGLPFIVLAVVHLFGVVFGAVGDVGLAFVLEPV
jgi:hypothetical protein